MHRNKVVKIAGIVIIATLLISITIGFFASTYSDMEGMRVVNIYFYNPITNKLEPEERIIPDGDIRSIVSYVSSILLATGPATAKLTMPVSLEEQGVGVVGEIRIVRPPSGDEQVTIEITFTNEYNQLPIADELLLRSSVVWTLTDLEFVEKVRIIVDNGEGVTTSLLRANGQIIGDMDRENTKINPQLTPEKISNQTVTLYFPTGAMTGLSPEIRTIEAATQSVERLVVENIIAGPATEGLSGIFSSTADIQLLDVEITEKVCYINVNAAFISRLPVDGPERRLAVYAIVNSLTGLSDGNISWVRFLLEGEKPEITIGGIDMGQLFERDESLILDQNVVFHESP